MSHETRMSRMPLILPFSECRNLNSSVERLVLMAGLVFKRDLHPVSILLIAIHDKQRPLAIGTFQGICCYHRMSRAVVDVTAGGKYIMQFLARSDPLQINQLGREELS